MYRESGEIVKIDALKISVVYERRVVDFGRLWDASTTYENEHGRGFGGFMDLGLMSARHLCIVIW